MRSIETNRLWHVLFAIALSAVLVACGDDDDDGGTDMTTDTVAEMTEDTADDTVEDTTGDTEEDTTVPEGQMLYEMTPETTPCVSCHGVTGMGDGLLADQYDPPPTDLTAYAGSAADIEDAIVNGIGEMPAVAGLSADQLSALVDYVIAFQQ